MIYKFNWTQTIHGEIEIKANSGIEAEQIFREMQIDRQIASSKNIQSDEQKLLIDFVDIGFFDLLSGTEWKTTWKNIV